MDSSTLVLCLCDRRNRLPVALPDLRASEHVRLSGFLKKETRLELLRAVRPYARGHECPGLRRTNGLTRARFGKYDVPEIHAGHIECNSHKAPFPLLAQGSHHTVNGLGGMLVDNFDHLAAEQGSVHEKQSAVGTDDVGGGLEVDGFALRQATPNSQRNLEGKASGASTLGISGSLHKQPWRGRLGLNKGMVPRSRSKHKELLKRSRVEVPLTCRINPSRFQKSLVSRRLAPD